MSSPTATGWSTCDVGGHACDLFQPATVAAAGRAILYLHDLDGQSPRNLPSLQTVLEQVAGDLSKAARALQVDDATLQALLQKHGLEGPRQ